jgi:hypothetical protein
MAAQKRRRKKMRKKPKTILLAKVRRLIREAAKWYAADKGMPQFWSSENWRLAKEPKRNERGFISGN